MYRILLLTLPLAACALAANPMIIGPMAAAIPIFHRTPLDMAWSAATGRDCSIVNLDKGERYCRERDPAPDPPVFCTRSLGIPDCWADPKRLPNAPKEIADGPRTPARAMRWPGF